MLPDSSFEVIIIGAGISGLLIASELSSRHKVLVLEANAQIGSSKYWLTDKESATANPTLLEAVDCHYESLDFVSHDEIRYRCRGEYVLWDTQKLVDLLADRIVAQGGSVLLRHTFYSYSVDTAGINVFANDRTFRAKLLVDCMGYHSPIIYARNMIDVHGFFVLYGATFRSKQPLSPVGLHNLCLNTRPTYVEAFPTADGRLHLILILASKVAQAVTSLREEFDFLINRSPYSNVIDGSSPVRDFLGGIIPVGKLRSTAADRLFLFGEAGQVNPAATATALTKMLRSYREVAVLLTEHIRDDRLSGGDLRQIRCHRVDGLNERLHLALFRDILTWNSGRFATLVREMAVANDHKLVNAIMFGDLHSSPGELISTAGRLFKARSFNILKYVVQGFSPTSGARRRNP